MIFYVETEKAFEKIHHIFIILKTLGLEETYLKIIRLPMINL
jgi:hypothetical protein